MARPTSETYNANYIGGDINEGRRTSANFSPGQSRAWCPIRRPGAAYICSSSTPPGGGVHGLCGYHAAREANRTIVLSEDTSLIDGP